MAKFNEGGSVVLFHNNINKIETTEVGATLAGELTAVPSPAIVATLLVVTEIQGGPASDYTIAGDLTGATQSGGSYTFATTCTLNGGSGYTFTSGPTITNATVTITGSQTVVTTITGTLALSLINKQNGNNI